MSDNYKRLWLPFKSGLEDRDSVTKWTIVEGYESEDCKKVDKEISELLKKGWSIASTSPVTATANKPSDYGGIVQFTYTAGIEVFMVKTNV